MARTNSNKEKRTKTVTVMLEPSLYELFNLALESRYTTASEFVRAKIVEVVEETNAKFTKALKQ